MGAPSEKWRGPQTMRKRGGAIMTGQSCLKVTELWGEDMSSSSNCDGVMSVLAAAGPLPVPFSSPLAPPPFSGPPPRTQLAPHTNQLDMGHSHDQHLPRVAR